MPELGIGDTENCAIGDSGHADQDLFVFGGIDVYPRFPTERLLPEAQRPKSSAIHKLSRPITPSLR
ncbi:hypothetical protein, partial [Bradyrhizobium sp.]|uniref:hypothetical protein n=1 Tax=Bradyrhizobium sp. TaxID=376 RepID=UPI003C746BA2